MADYQKMYALLCGAVDDVIDPLEQIPLAIPYASVLRRALEDAEELYIETADRRNKPQIFMRRLVDDPVL